MLDLDKLLRHSAVTTNRLYVVGRVVAFKVLLQCSTDARPVAAVPVTGGV